VITPFISGRRRHCALALYPETADILIPSDSPVHSFGCRHTAVDTWAADVVAHHTGNAWSLFSVVSSGKSAGPKFIFSRLYIVYGIGPCIPFVYHHIS